MKEVFSIRCENKNFVHSKLVEIQEKKGLKNKTEAFIFLLNNFETQTEILPQTQPEKNEVYTLVNDFFMKIKEQLDTLIEKPVNIHQFTKMLIDLAETDPAEQIQNLLQKNGYVNEDLQAEIEALLFPLEKSVNDIYNEQSN